MPAPRACRRCGRDLPTDIRRCPSCSEPIAEFTARAPMHAPGTFVGHPVVHRATTRWGPGSPTTFGRLGRITITLVLVPGAAVLFWIFFSEAWLLGLSGLLGYAIVAAFALREVWRPVPVDEASAGAKTRLDRFAERHPILGRRVHPGLWAVPIFGMLALAGPRLWSRADDQLRFLLVIGLVTACLGWGLAVWLLDR